MEISLNNVTFGYNSQEILKNISYTFQSGKFHSIVGQSGCGKSTLLRLISSLITPNSGNISIEGKQPVELINNHEIAFMFQDPTLFENRTVRENIELPFLISGKKFDQCNIHDLLDIVGLKNYLNYFPHELSGGMRSRVALARIFSFNPKVLLMDEPFSAIDEIKRAELIRELEIIKQTRKVTIVYVTHDIAEAVYLADQVIVLGNTPAKICATYEIPFQHPRSIDLFYSTEMLTFIQEIKQTIYDVSGIK